MPRDDQQLLDAPPVDPAPKSLWTLLVRDRKLIIWIVAVFTLVAGVGALFQEKEYKSTVQFSVVTNQDKNGAAGMMSQFGGAIASMTGMSIGGESEKFEAIALLQSRILTETYIERNNLLPILYYKLWDPVAGRWKTSDPKQIPTLWKAELRFRKIRSVVQDPKTGLVTISITWRDPVLAATWANGLVALTNERTRNRAVQVAQRHVNYLTDEFRKTQLVPVQTALSTLMENEYKDMMVAGGNDEYALKVIDPAAVSETPSSIRRSIIVLGGTLGGLFIGCLFVFLRASWRGER